MSGYVMTVPEFTRWIEKFKIFPAKFWLGSRAHIGKYIRERHIEHMNAHQTPDGQPWKDTFAAPKPEIGQRAPMIVNPGKMPNIGAKTRLQSARSGSYPAVVTETIQSAAGRRRAVAFRKRYGPPFKPEKALIRKTGKRRAKRIWEFLSKAGRSIRNIKRANGYGLEYGYTRGTRWIEALQNGGWYHEGSNRSVFKNIMRLLRGAPRVPARAMVGLNSADIEYIVGYLEAQYEKFLTEGRDA